MAIIQGTSVLGLQLTDISTPPETGRFAIDFSGTIPPNRLLRVGTVLACHRIPAPTRFRVVRAYKLYGHGMLAESPINLVQTPIDLELWIRWFVPGLLWTVQFF
jgi:hypothetical protein